MKPKIIDHPRGPRFKSHNCKVIDTRQATYFDYTAPRGQEVKLRTGGLKQETLIRKPNHLGRRLKFVKTGLPTPEPEIT